MRHRELTTPELERRIERIIADRYYNQLSGERISQNAIRQGVEAGRSRYIASLMPGRATRQREFLQRQQREAERRRWAQQRLVQVT
jgi:hypothetical protein